jgi:hypothetical protein
MLCDYSSAMSAPMRAARANSENQLAVANENLPFAHKIPLPIDLRQAALPGLEGKSFDLGCVVGPLLKEQDDIESFGKIHKGVERFVGKNTGRCDAGTSISGAIRSSYRTRQVPSS